MLHSHQVDWYSEHLGNRARIDSIINFAPFLAWMCSAFGLPHFPLPLAPNTVISNETFFDPVDCARCFGHFGEEEKEENTVGCGRIIDEDGSMRRFPPCHAGKATDCNYIDKLAGRIIVFQNSPRMKNELPRLVRERWASCSHKQNRTHSGKGSRRARRATYKPNPFPLFLLSFAISQENEGENTKMVKSVNNISLGCLAISERESIGVTWVRALSRSRFKLGRVGKCRNMMRAPFLLRLLWLHVKQISLELLSTCRTGGKCRRSYKSNIHTGM